MINLESLVGTKQKVFYPWKSKKIERVIRKDQEGFYILYEGKRLKLEPLYNGMGDSIVGFKAIHGRREDR